MMNFFTPIKIERGIFSFSYEDNILLLGSCFVENIGKLLEENRFHVDTNPFGTLYNPASIAAAIRSLITPKQYTQKDIFEHEEVYHSFSHHSRFSSSSPTEILENMNHRLHVSSNELKQISRIVITFGSAYVYTLKNNQQIVANCHKLPEKLFLRKMLSVDDIVKEWEELLLLLWDHHPKVKLLFTVSPIRHWKEGAHQNQLSKATLLLAIDKLQAKFPDRIDYFPAYEIMMDELRDYRFYANDMLHPSSLAVDYIWQLFAANRLTKESQSIFKEWNEILKALNHKPFQPESDRYKQFIHQTLLKMEQLQEKMPSFDIGEETKELLSRLNR